MLSSQGKNAPSDPYPNYLVRLGASRSELWVPEWEDPSEPACSFCHLALPRVPAFWVQNLGLDLPKGPFRTKNTTTIAKILNYYAVVFLLRRTKILVRRGPFFERKNVCNSQENGVRTRRAAIVNHPAVLETLRVVNLLRVVFLVRRGPFGRERGLAYRAKSGQNTDTAFLALRLRVVLDLLTTRGFGPPPPPHTVRSPPLSGVSALFSCSKIHDRADQKLFWRGPKIFERARSLVRFPPPMCFAPPISRSKNNVCQPVF